jgi:hypothetical protein
MSGSIRPLDLFPNFEYSRNTNVAYGTGGGFVADKIAPIVNVTAPNFQYPTYKADAMNVEIKTEVGPGGKPNQWRSTPPTWTKGSVSRRALDGTVNREVQLFGGPRASTMAVAGSLTHSLRLGMEQKVKALLDVNATLAGHHAAPAVKWDAASAVVIEKNLDVAREAFLLLCGYEANTIVIPPLVAKSMKRDTTIRDLRKYTEPNLLVNGDLPPNIWGLETVIPGALGNGANPGATAAVSRIWGTDSVYLLYVDPNIAGTGETMTALAQYRYSGWGQPYAVYTWPEPHQSQRVDWVSVDIFDTVLTICADAIYVLDDVLT